MPRTSVCPDCVHIHEQKVWFKLNESLYNALYSYPRTIDEICVYDTQHMSSSDAMYRTSCDKTGGIWVILRTMGWKCVGFSFSDGLYVLSSRVLYISGNVFHEMFEAFLVDVVSVFIQYSETCRVYMCYIKPFRSKYLGTLFSNACNLHRVR